MNINDLDLNAAAIELQRHSSTQQRSTAEAMLKAAIPPVTDWNGTEELRINHRVLFVTPSVEHPESSCICKVLYFANPQGAGVDDVAVEYEDGELGVISKRFFKPIPQVKKIDHSSLAHTMIDCAYNEDGESDYYIPYDKSHSQYLKSIRMNHWMVWEGSLDSLRAAIPEGYEWGCSPTGLLNNVAFKVAAVKEGYTL